MSKAKQLLAAIRVNKRINDLMFSNPLSAVRLRAASFAPTPRPKKSPTRSSPKMPLVYKHQPCAD